MCSLLVTSLGRINNTFPPLCHSTIISENWTSRRVTIQTLDVQYMTHMYAIVYPGPVFFYLANCKILCIQYYTADAHVLVISPKEFNLFQFTFKRNCYFSRSVHSTTIYNNYLTIMFFLILRLFSNVWRGTAEYRNCCLKAETCKYCMMLRYSESEEKLSCSSSEFRPFLSDRIRLVTDKIVQQGRPFSHLSTHSPLENSNQ